MKKQKIIKTLRVTVAVPAFAAESASSAAASLPWRMTDAPLQVCRGGWRAEENGKNAESPPRRRILKNVSL